MESAVTQDIAWSPSSKLELINFQKVTGKDKSASIKIYEDYESKMIELTTILQKQVYFTTVQRS